jgi:hypothetical protein
LNLAAITRTFLSRRRHVYSCKTVYICENRMLVPAEIEKFRKLLGPAK